MDRSAALALTTLVLVLGAMAASPEAPYAGGAEPGAPPLQADRLSPPSEGRLGANPSEPGLFMRPTNPTGAFGRWLCTPPSLASPYFSTTRLARSSSRASDRNHSVGSTPHTLVISL